MFVFSALFLNISPQKYWQEGSKDPILLFRCQVVLGLFAQQIVNRRPSGRMDTNKSSGSTRIRAPSWPQNAFPLPPAARGSATIATHCIPRSPFHPKQPILVLVPCTAIGHVNVFMLEKSWVWRKSVEYIQLLLYL